MSLFTEKMSPGHIPYGMMFFSERCVKDFIEYLREKIAIAQNEKDEIQLQEIVLNLREGTLVALTHDKPYEVCHGIIMTFCNLFNNTEIDPIYVSNTFFDKFEKKWDNAEYNLRCHRKYQRNLFADANNALFRNVRNALRIGDTFMSLPIDGIIVWGSTNFINGGITFNDKVYPQSVAIINDVIVPCLPMKPSGSRISDQCLRQWIRQIISKMYNVDYHGDICIYIILGLVLQVILSDVDISIKDAYKLLGLTMLRKKRLNSNQSELLRLESGEIPIPNNGNIDDFYGYMTTVMKLLKFRLVRPFTLWYAMCLALHNDQLILNQLVHCRKDILADFSIEPIDLLTNFADISMIRDYELPKDVILEYHCLITLDDTILTGGYCILPHKSESGSCSPKFVFSNEGYADMMTSGNVCQCPICYSLLSKINFSKVGPKQFSEITVFDADTVDVFKTSGVSVVQSVVASVSSLRSESK